MATLPLPMMLSQLSLHAIVSCIVLTAGTAGASTAATSTQAVRGLGPVQDVGLIDSQNAVRSGLSFCLGLVRQLGLSDMVQLVAFCGFIQSIRIWRRRSVSQAEGMGDAGYSERKDSSNTKRESFWSSTGSPKLGMPKSRPISGNTGDLTTLHRRCRVYRPWPVAKTFYLQVLHHILCHLPFDPKVLQTASSSR